MSNGVTFEGKIMDRDNKMITKQLSCYDRVSVNQKNIIIKHPTSV